MFSWVLVSFDCYHVNLLIFGENVLYFLLEFQHYSSCFLFSPFYLWGKIVKTFPRLSRHWEELGENWKVTEKQKPPLLWQWWAGPWASVGVKGKAVPRPLKVLLWVLHFNTVRRWTTSGGSFQWHLFCLSQKQKSFTLIALLKRFSFKNLIQYLIKISRDVSSFLKDTSSFTDRREKTLYSNLWVDPVSLISLKTSSIIIELTRDLWS